MWMKKYSNKYNASHRGRSHGPRFCQLHLFPTVGIDNVIWKIKLLSDAESRLCCLSRDSCFSRASNYQGSTAVPGCMALLLFCVVSVTFFTCPFIPEVPQLGHQWPKSTRGWFGQSWGELSTTGVQHFPKAGHLYDLLFKGVNCRDPNKKIWVKGVMEEHLVVQTTEQIRPSCL